MPKQIEGRVLHEKSALCNTRFQIHDKKGHKTDKTAGRPKMRQPEHDEDRHEDDRAR